MAHPASGDVWQTTPVSRILYRLRGGSHLSGPRVAARLVAM